ncbi:unnamed protein product [Tenebrio molitor]|nr:unnamed protein product [Tenebrio molitor]
MMTLAPTLLRKVSFFCDISRLSLVAPRFKNFPKFDSSKFHFLPHNFYYDPLRETKAFKVLYFYAFRGLCPRLIFNEYVVFAFCRVRVQPLFLTRNGFLTVNFLNEKR